MLSKVSQRNNPIDGVLEIRLAGSAATVEVEVGSEVDGLLYYHCAMGNRPALGLAGRPDRRFAVEHVGGATYKLPPSSGVLA